MKREVYIRLGFCEGGAINVDERGLFAKWRRGEVSLSWPLGRPWERERKRDICGGDILVEVSGSVWKKMEFGILENWKRLWLVEEGKK